MTRDEYEALVRRGALDDARVELLYGRLISSSPQGEPHAYSVSQQHGRGENLPLAVFADVVVSVDEVLPPVRHP
jgi:hypothetical protein